MLERFSLPLLTKELIEQAQNKRTYILRVIYAVALYGAALFQYADLSNGGTSAGLMNLGRGQVFFQLLVAIQASAILILLPAMTCGAVTVEKEKDTLALLLLTKLSPWTIVFEKLLSRVFAMGTYQLLSLPLFAIVYGMGGVELSGLIAAICALLCLTVVVASISIICSTWFRTTAEAFIMAYLLLICVSPCWLLPSAIVLAPSSLDAVILSVGLVTATCVVSAICLTIASRVLVMRAFVPPRNVLLEVFQSADRYFNDLNKKTTGGIVLVPDRETLPSFQPIVWRETRKKSLGTFRYQFRILMLLLAPLILAIAAILSDGRNDFTSPFRGFPVFFWSVTLICLTIHATGVIPAERIRQSLDVLLVAPMTPAEIVLGKLSGVRRMIKILTVPFVVLIAFQAIWSGYVIQGMESRQTSNFWLELAAASLSVIVYMPLLMWVGYQFGLRMRNQMQAVLATFASVAIVCVIPLTLARALSSNEAPGYSLLRWLSPAQIIFSKTDFMAGNTFPENAIVDGLAIALNFILYGMTWHLIRKNALQSFSRIVRRMEESAAAANGIDA